VCVVLYAHLDRDGISGQSIFQSFPSAFLNLYLLSLTVNDPDTYLPYYKHAFMNFFVFASFMIITFFMIHNIILARIFQIYSDKLKETAVKRKENRHKALFLAFEALDETKDGFLPKELLAYVLKRLRPKYSTGKIETLMRHSNKVCFAGGGASFCFPFRPSISPCWRQYSRCARSQRTLHIEQTDTH